MIKVTFLPAEVMFVFVKAIVQDSSLSHCLRMEILIAPRADCLSKLLKYFLPKI